MGHLFLNIESLGICDLGTQWESFQVPAHSDSSAHNHLRVILVEGRSVQSVSTHISLASMLFDSMISFDDLIKEVNEGNIGVMRARIDSDSRVSVLTAGEDGLFERKA